MTRKRCNFEKPGICIHHHEGCRYSGHCEHRGTKDYEEETIMDVLKWVEAITHHYKHKYDPERALNGIIGEIQTCIAIGAFPDNDGTRFRDATEKLRGL